MDFQKGDILSINDETDPNLISEESWGKIVKLNERHYSKIGAAWLLDKRADFVNGKYKLVCRGPEIFTTPKSQTQYFLVNIFIIKPETEPQPKIPLIVIPVQLRYLKIIYRPTKHPLTKIFGSFYKPSTQVEKVWTEQNTKIVDSGEGAVYDDDNDEEYWEGYNNNDYE